MTSSGWRAPVGSISGGPTIESWKFVPGPRPSVRRCRWSVKCSPRSASSSCSAAPGSESGWLPHWAAWSGPSCSPEAVCRPGSRCC